MVVGAAAVIVLLAPCGSSAEVASAPAPPTSAPSGERESIAPGQPPASQPPATAPALLPRPAPPALGIPPRCHEFRFIERTRVALFGVQRRAELGGDFVYAFCMEATLQVGASVGFNTLTYGADQRTGVAFLGAMVGKLNFGARGSRWNPFIEASVGAFVMVRTPTRTGDDALTMYDLALRGGIELFVSRHISLNVTPGFELAGDARATMGFFQVAAGLSAYF